MRYFLIGLTQEVSPWRAICTACEQVASEGRATIIVMQKCGKVGIIMDSAMLFCPKCQKPILVPQFYKDMATAEFEVKILMCAPELLEASPIETYDVIHQAFKVSEARLRAAAAAEQSKTAK